MSAVALVQELSRLLFLLLQLLDSKLQLVASLCGLVALLRVHPCHQAVGVLQLPIPNTLLFLQWPVAWRAEMKRSQCKGMRIEIHKHTIRIIPYVDGNVFLSTALYLGFPSLWKFTLMICKYTYSL